MKYTLEILIAHIRQIFPASEQFIGITHFDECGLQFVFLGSNLADDKALSSIIDVWKTIYLTPKFSEPVMRLRVLLFDQLQANNSSARIKKINKLPVIATHNKGAGCAFWRGPGVRQLACCHPKEDDRTSHFLQESIRF